MIHQNSPSNLLSSGKTQCTISLTNETWQHSSVQFSMLAEKRKRGTEGAGGVGWERECMCPFGPSFWTFSQSNECERECKGNRGPCRAELCLNNLITIHLFHSICFIYAFVLTVLISHPLWRCLSFHILQLSKEIKTGTLQLCLHLSGAAVN